MDEAERAKALHNWDLQKQQMAQMMEWNHKRKADAENQKRNEDQYFAECARENERRRREKEDALAEYFRQLNN